MKLIRLTYLPFLFIASICFLSVEINPKPFLIIGLLSFGILPSLVINLFYSFYFIFRKHYFFFFLTLLVFGLGFKHVDRTFNLITPQEKGEIKVLNSNVRIFNVYKHLRNENSQSSKDMIKWIANNDADILILQEFYNLDTSKIWSTTKQISKKYPFNYLHVSLYNRVNSEFGQIIFSKHPIINSGIIPYENKTFNQALFADVLFKSDTIRIYNIHLQSMKIEERKLFDDKNSEDEIKEKVKDTSSKLLSGVRLRINQIEKIIDHIKNSPYPVIVGSDMNDIPYGYSYNEFSKILTNSFDKKGNGFGFTFNGKLFFLRIDNLFSSSEFETNSFKVHREIPYSDHFPISASYTLKD